LTYPGFEEKYPTNPEDAWKRLSTYNERFVTGSLVEYLKNIAGEIGFEVRHSFTEGGQHPYATVLTCSDSRVSPEIIFGEGLGLLFVVRVAGNVLDPATLGSIEYGILHLKTPLLLIMGHEKCGAVIAAADPAAKHAGAVGQLLKLVQPAIKYSAEVNGPDWYSLKEKEPKKFNEAVDKAVMVNVLVTRNSILRQSEGIRVAASQGKLKIVPALYHIESGRVQPIPEEEIVFHEDPVREHGLHHHHRVHHGGSVKKT